MGISAISTSIDPIVEQKIQIPYSYVAGPAVGRFLTGLKDGVFCASECTACGRKSVPPLSFCGRCWEPITRFTSVGPAGVLESFADVADPTGQPRLYALIRLNGASNSLAHLLELAPGEKPQVGAEVEPVWKEQRTGSILDICHFRLRKSR